MVNGTIVVRHDQIVSNIAPGKAIRGARPAK